MSHSAALAVVLTAVSALATAQQPAPTPVPSDAPLSSLAAVTLRAEFGGHLFTLPQLLRVRVHQYAAGTLGDAEFPLANAYAEDLRTLPELRGDVVVSWFDALTDDASVGAPRFGANVDYVAWFGDGWDRDWKDGVVGGPPQWNGSGSAGLLWVNHEYISNSPPTPTSAPTGQMATLARFLHAHGVLTNDVTSNEWSRPDVDTFLRWSKRELGGSLMRVEQDLETLRWRLVRDAGNRRYDGTSATLLRITGYRTLTTDHHDDGRPLPEGVVAGILGDCSGGQSPWGTIFTAEENVQDYYGDLETCWSVDQRFLRGQGFDAGARIRPPHAPSRAAEYGQMANAAERHARDNHGFLVEIDPKAPAGRAYTSVANEGDGTGHRKLGGMGRARWENATFAVDRDHRPFDGKPIVVYGGDDRRSGRVFKFVSRDPYRVGMTAGEVRALLDVGSVHVAHFDGLDNRNGHDLLRTGALPTESAPGQGRWIHVSVDSEDIAPNAKALGKPGTTVGAALRDLDYNRIGGFADDDDVRRALFTACNKIGVMELNRPEDVEWNAVDRSGRARIYVAFTNHTLQTALDQEGRVFDPDEHARLAPKRNDRVGSIVAMEEADPTEPGASRAFGFWVVWRGTTGRGPFDAACPDNLMLDRDGGLWFGTDGNVGVNGTADAIYYLDLDVRNRAGAPGIVHASFGRPFRVVATPSDAEATGPCLTSDERTLFLGVQHPGEDYVQRPSKWPPR
jgi:secreted PhoX family phosphatase